MKCETCKWCAHVQPVMQKPEKPPLVQDKLLVFNVGEPREPDWMESQLYFPAWRDYYNEYFKWKERAVERAYCTRYPEPVLLKHANGCGEHEPKPERLTFKDLPLPYVASLPVTGETIKEMKANVDRTSAAYAQGDMILRWVNEGAIIMHEMKGK